MHNMEHRVQLLHSGPVLGALVTMLWLEGLCWSISMWACASRGRVRETTDGDTQRSVGHGTERQRCEILEFKTLWLQIVSDIIPHFMRF